MTVITATPAQENDMNDITGVSPDECAVCGSDVWADDETGLYFDVRSLRGTEGMCCPDTDDAHRV